MFLYKCSFREAEKIFIRKVVTAGINLDCISGQLSEMKKYKQDKKEVYRVELPLQATNDEPMWEYLKDRSETKQHNLMDVNFIVSRYGLYFCDIGQFRRRIIMPLRSPNGEYVYFTNRAIDHWAKKNLFPKNSNAMDYVYGLYESLGKKKAILTEGPFDLYQLKSFALRNHIDDFGFIASLGTEIQEERAAIIGQYFDEVYILDDSDEAGFDGERKAYKVLNEYIKTYKITDRVYKGKDPATLNEKQLRHVFAFRPTSRLLVTV
jgi:DNA primase